MRVLGKAMVLLAALAGLLGGGAVSAATGPVPTDDMSLGNPKAKVTVVEYASASCPHCARFNNNVLPGFRKKYVDTGKVRYVLREFLTQPVQVAAAGFLLARCAGSDRYFSTLDDFFRGQEEMYRTGDVAALIKSVGAKAGLKPAQIEACMSDHAAQDELNARIQRNAALDKVDSTPTFVINGVKLAESDHEVNLADLDAAIGPPLAKSKGR